MAFNSLARCLACGSDNVEVCRLLGHIYPVEYKAHGAQLRVPPEAKGIPYDEWAQRKLYDPAEVKEFFRNLEVGMAEPKPTRKKR